MGKLPTRSMFFVNNMRYLFLLPLILLAGCGQPKQEFWLTFQSVDPGLHRQVVITCYDKDCYIGREPNAPYTLGFLEPSSITPTLAAAGGTSPTTTPYIERTYVFTYVDQYGQEFGC